MAFWRKKIRTHAVALWSLVGACAVLLIVVLVYAAMDAKISSGVPTVNPPLHAETNPGEPTLFGTVTEVAAPGVITVDSKQPFTTIYTDEMTKISALGGAPFQLTALRPGAVITATGADLGGGKMTANAIVIISNPGTASSVIGAPTPAAAPDDVVAAIGTGSRQLTASFTLARNDGSKSSQITPSETSTWWLSADGKTLVDVEISKNGKRTLTTYDMTTRHIVE